MRRTRATAALLLLLAGLFGLLAVPASAQDDEGSATSEDGILSVRAIDGTDKKAVELTLLWNGEPTDLEELVIRENGQAVKVQSLTDLRQTGKSLATAVVVDLSGSMNDDGALSRAKAAISELVQNLPQGDQMAIVSFTNDVDVETAFTSNADQLQEAIDGLAAPRDGRTAMYDGIRKATSLFTTRPDLQPNVLLVTDGSDDVSSSDLAGARASVASSGAAFFAVQLTHMDEVDTGAISSIIERSGGAAFSGSTEAEVDEAFVDVMTTMRSQFVATYESRVDQGAIDVDVAVGTRTVETGYVAGSTAEGGKATQVVLTEKAFGPDWLRSTPLLPVLFAGVAIGLAVYAGVMLASKNDTGLQAVLSPYTEGSAEPDENDGALAQTAFLQRAVEMTEDFAERQGFLEKVSGMLERADMPLRAAEALFFYLAGVVLIALMGIFGLGFMPGLILAVLAALLPPAIVNFMASRRGKKFVGQLPDTLHLLSGSLRAGYSLMQGVEAVSQEVEEPMGKELRRVVTEARLGRELEESLDAVAERMSSPDFAWAVMAIRIQREVGGNLSELLLTVSETMVQRDRLRRDVAALTAEGKMSAIILGLLPIGLGLFMWSANPEYMAPLGSTGMGQALLGAALVAILVGFAWMKKTITIDI